MQDGHQKVFGDDLRQNTAMRKRWTESAVRAEEPRKAAGDGDGSDIDIGEVKGPKKTSLESKTPIGVYWHVGQYSKQFKKKPTKKNAKPASRADFLHLMSAEAKNLAPAVRCVLRSDEPLGPAPPLVDDWDLLLDMLDTSVSTSEKAVWPAFSELERFCCRRLKQEDKLFLGLLRYFANWPDSMAFVP